MSSKPFSPFPSQDDQSTFLVQKNMRFCKANQYTLYFLEVKGGGRLFFCSQVQNIESRGIDAGADYLNEIRQLSMLHGRT